MQIFIAGRLSISHTSKCRCSVTRASIKSVVIATLHDIVQSASDADGPAGVEREEVAINHGPYATVNRAFFEDGLGIPVNDSGFVIRRRRHEHVAAISSSRILLVIRSYFVIGIAITKRILERRILGPGLIELALLDTLFNGRVNLALEPVDGVLVGFGNQDTNRVLQNATLIGFGFINGHVRKANFGSDSHNNLQFVRLRFVRMFACSLTLASFAIAKFDALIIDVHLSLEHILNLLPRQRVVFHKCAQEEKYINHLFRHVVHIVGLIAQRTPRLPRGRFLQFGHFIMKRRNQLIVHVTPISGRPYSRVLIFLGNRITKDLMILFNHREHICRGERLFSFHS
nr:MAG TPA: hypothetical protein [Caudoviricetes sp.]